MVFVLDRKKKPLMPCSEKRAGKLLREGRAVMHCLVPFVIRLNDRVRGESSFQPLKLKIDPGYEVRDDVWLELWERFDAWLEKRYMWFFYFAFGYLAVQVVRVLVD